ncbi:MAG: biotin carboxyl carrier protein [Bacteroidia bacterium]|jgi:biotin carboxyl carrier protein
MYKATINDQHTFDIDANQVNGEKTKFDCELLPDGTYHILLNNKSMAAEIIQVNRNTKTVKLLVDQKTYVVQVEDEFDHLLSKMGIDKTASEKVSEVKSPMPGLVLAINVKIGDIVEAGDPLMVLEAMKMENVIAAPNEGVIAKIEVKTQDKVDKNQVLLRFEQA